MQAYTIGVQDLEAFSEYLYREEKSKVTIEKYLRDVRAFSLFLQQQELIKENTLAYKKYLIDRGYAPRSINSMLVSINRFFCFLNKEDCRIKQIKLQKQIFCTQDKQLSRCEYQRLLDAAKGKERLYLLLQKICATGIRVSELSYFTVEAVQQGEVLVSCKNKTRNILLPSKLRRRLLAYAKTNNIHTGVIFRTCSGRPMDRSNIWREMHRLCKTANVATSKVFPHNLRKLFARTFYKIEKDIAKLADILGHTNINTTRIYIMSTGEEHRQKIEALKLVV